MIPLSLADVLAGVVLVSLTAYALLGGADFGGGVWDLFARGERRQAQRDLITRAIGPVWEANHVWLILVIVLLFTCFPPVFSTLGVVLHVPLTLMLVGIVLRGSAFTFRSYDSRRDAVQQRWSRLFAIASLLTPVLLGISIGAIASGRVGMSGVSIVGVIAPTGALVPATPVAPGRMFVVHFIWPWAFAFPVAVGVLALALFAYLAAVYLTVEAEDGALRDDFRRRALAAGIVSALCALVVLLLSGAAAPRVRHGLTATWWGIAIQLATAGAAGAALWALWTRRFRLARLAAGAEVALVLWGWALAQYPYLVPPYLTIDGTAAPRATLALVLGALAVGAGVLFPSLAYLLRVFKGRGRVARG